MHGYCIFNFLQLFFLSVGEYGRCKLIVLSLRVKWNIILLLTKEVETLGEICTMRNKSCIRMCHRDTLQNFPTWIYCFLYPTILLSRYKLCDTLTKILVTLQSLYSCFEWRLIAFWHWIYVAKVPFIISILYELLLLMYEANSGI